MSYGVRDRFGGLNVDYDHRRCVADNRFSGCGTWWPDFGPRRTDFNDAGTCHPTSTIFENVIEKPAKQRAAALAGAEGSLRQFRHPGTTDEDFEKYREQRRQFRNPDPARDALWKSTIIQPYKSGGRLQRDIVGAWSRDEAKDIEKHSGAAAGQASGLASLSPKMVRSLSQPSLAAASFSKSIATLGQSIDQSASFSKRPGDSDSASQHSSAFESVAASEPPMPQWVASRTFATRPVDAAGHAASRLRTLSVCNLRNSGAPSPEITATRTLSQALPHHGSVLQTLRSGNTVGASQLR